MPGIMASVSTIADGRPMMVIRQRKTMGTYILS